MLLKKLSFHFETRVTARYDFGKEGQEKVKLFDI